MEKRLSRHEAAEYLFHLHNLPITEENLSSLRRDGRGPRPWTSSEDEAPYKEVDIDRWVDCHFSDASSSGAVYSYQNRPSPTWLVASECPLIASILRRQLFAFGLNLVEPWNDSKSIISAASYEEYDGAFLSFDLDPEVAELAMDMFSGRKKPFIFCTELPEVSSTARWWGQVLRHSFNFTALVNAIQRAAPEVAARLDFSVHLDVIDAQDWRNTENTEAILCDGCSSFWGLVNGERCDCPKLTRADEPWVPHERDVMRFNQEELSDPNRQFQ